MDGESGTGVRGIENPTGCDGWASVVLSWTAIVKKVVKSTEDKYMVFLDEGAIEERSVEQRVLKGTLV